MNAFTVPNSPETCTRSNTAHFSLTSSPPSRHPTGRRSAQISGKPSYTKGAAHPIEALQANCAASLRMLPRGNLQLQPPIHSTGLQQQRTNGSFRVTQVTSRGTRALLHSGRPTAPQTGSGDAVCDRGERPHLDALPMETETLRPPAPIGQASRQKTAPRRGQERSPEHLHHVIESVLHCSHEANPSRDDREHLRVYAHRADQ